MGFDIIGDIHGHADQLEGLLRKLGYRSTGGAWRHPDRTAIFVGDLIDRGPSQLRTLELVRAMIEAGSAQITMGNHEFNAIGWATPDPSNAGWHLRPRHGAKGLKNRHQHAAFLSELGDDTRLHREWIAWFMDMPLWIEMQDFRVVHACWSERHADSLRPLLRPGNRLSEQGIVAVYDKDTEAFKAADLLLKGPEIRLPNGASFADKDGHIRHEIRTRWWDSGATTFRTAYIGPGGVDIPDLPLLNAVRIPVVDRPTFIGHYWLEPDAAVAPLSSRVVCVDYSVAKGGPLVAYRFDGEPDLSAAHFVTA